MSVPRSRALEELRSEADELSARVLEPLPRFLHERVALVPRLGEVRDLTLETTQAPFNAIEAGAEVAEVRLAQDATGVAHVRRGRHLRTVPALGRGERSSQDRVVELEHLLDVGSRDVDPVTAFVPIDLRLRLLGRDAGQTVDAARPNRSERSRVLDRVQPNFVEKRRRHGLDQGQVADNVGRIPRHRGRQTESMEGDLGEDPLRLHSGREGLLAKAGLLLDVLGKPHLNARRHEILCFWAGFRGRWSSHRSCRSSGGFFAPPAPCKVT